MSSLTFQSIRSSSAGNCLVLRSQATTLLIDCGLRTQRDCEDLLVRQLGGGLFVHGLLVTHAHSDHIGYPALRSLAKHDVAIHSHDHVLRHVSSTWEVDRWPAKPRLTRFERRGGFEVGDFAITPMDVPHAPRTPNVGFVIRHGEKKVVVCTDFFDDSAVREQFVDADFIFVESNHCPRLLRLRPNYASHFHMSNPKTAALLCDAVRRSERPPRAVMLGHLSNERNTEALALGAVREAFEEANVPMEFDLSAAPKYAPSAVKVIG